MIEYHLKILGLQQGASQQDVKQAYRKLAKIYHPDIQKSGSSSESFLKIQQAYDYLMQWGTTSNYQQEVVSYFEQEIKRATADELWRNMAKAKVRMKAREQRLKKEAAFRKVINYSKYLIISILLFNVLLTMDFLLPKQQYELILPKLEFDKRHTDILLPTGRFRIDGFDLISVPRTLVLKVKTTSIFNKNLEAWLIKGQTILHFEPYYSVYHFYGILIPTLLIACGIDFIYLKKSDDIITLRLFLSVAFLFQLYLFFRY